VVGGKAMSVVDEIIDQKIKSYIEEIAALKRQNAMLKQEISKLRDKEVKD
jgi:cell division protein FtsB